MANEIEFVKNGSLLADARKIIEDSRANAVRSVDFCRVQMYWNLGRRIFEEEQQGKDRADYGSYLIKNLAAHLEKEYGSGFSERQLKFCRQFYKLYPIANALRSQLNWSQYRLLIQISDPAKREYYEIESANNGWTGRETERQINSQLYERLLIEDDEYFADLVFYNRLLRCFVVVELKTRKVTHEDLGQLQMYVNYYDRTEKLPDENSTIGILLCTAKNDEMVKLTLPKNNETILASKYELYLPSKEALQEEVEKLAEAQKKFTEAKINDGEQTDG